MADYQGDWVLKHAVQRGTEIISEASRALPDEVKALQPDIPGRQVRTIGNVLRHEYHGLADNIIWGVVVDELPALKAAIEALSERFADE
ncbi:HepT-like ribonuclease domain-containing protein [Mesorhizobium sp. ISC25]|uniref:HepT-like ribonuclease domain-containing protein n=1 Tax=Mesorhizobium sp. ISC25 TaxID=3077335 RepID=UPI0035D6C1E3